MTSPAIVVSSCALTDVGQKRDHNEDAYFASDDMLMYVVADGMGGHKAGEVASRIVVETMQDRMGQSSENVEGAELIKADEPLSGEATRLLAAIHLANQAVHHMSTSGDEYKGMGCTVSAVLFAGPRIVAANVGDSPIYLIRNDDIELLSVLHTYMAEHAALAPPDAKPLSEKYRHMITRAMGVKPEVVPSHCDIQGLQGDTIVICSDGLSDKLSPKEIHAVVKKYGVSKACKALVALANKRGGDDNITVIVVHVAAHPNRVGDAAPADTPRTKDPSDDTERAGFGGIAVDVDTDEASHSETLFGLTRDGGFIPTTDAYSVGEELTLTFADPAGEVIILEGTVSDRDPKGIHVKFSGITDDVFERLQALF